MRALQRINLSAIKQFKFTRDLQYNWKIRPKKGYINETKNVTEVLSVKRVPYLF